MAKELTVRKAISAEILRAEEELRLEDELKKSQSDWSGGFQAGMRAAADIAWPNYGDE